MSICVSIIGVTGKDSPEYKRHYEVARVCITNNVTIPPETEMFFNAMLVCGWRSDLTKEEALELIERGIEVNIPYTGDAMENGGAVINVSDIPSHVKQIIVEAS